MVAPAAMFTFILMAPVLYRFVTRRSIRVEWLRRITTIESGDPEPTLGDALIALVAVIISQGLATALNLDGTDAKPAVIAVVAGVIEWVVALAWLGLLVACSSPRDDSSGRGLD
jgi:hypothetical protein